MINATEIVITCLTNFYLKKLVHEQGIILDPSLVGAVCIYIELFSCYKDTWKSLGESGF